eukprot:TRINITY_DN2857_c0_g1_i1.p1 TRINITY_DN2857_c0_g1~~TRINITY_DN2857_c0_g1_i1.p1  ORF type:complete len:402 (+),score=118.24 TRINITY_DN2857_c0_g1_i1:173-1378(+)
MELKNVLKKFEEYAPTKTAEKWDNVGLLVEPYTSTPIKKIFMTNDLTEAVLEEAIASGANLIFSYHPPIFSAMKRLNVRDVKQRIVIRAIENRIAVYSPHTAVDALNGGVNDWLASAFLDPPLHSADDSSIESHAKVLEALKKGSKEGKVTVVQPHNAIDPNQAYKFVVTVPADSLDKVRSALGNVGLGQIGNYSQCSFAIPGTGTFQGNAESNPQVGKKENLESVQEMRLEMVCGKDKLGRAIEAVKASHPYETPAWEVYPLEPTPVPDTGMGRIVKLDQPQTLAWAIDRIKKHLKMDHIRVAIPQGSSVDQHRVSKIAICAGSGASVIGSSHADLLFSGEMGHHDVLAAIERKSAVALCDHSNTERGYLQFLKRHFRHIFNDSIEIEISQVDRDPLQIM